MDKRPLLVVAALVTAGLVALPAAPAAAGGTTIGTTKTLVSPRVGNEPGTGDSHESLNHDGNSSLTSTDGDTGPNGSASGSVSISSTATPTRVTATGTATATQTANSHVDLGNSGVSLETITTTPGQWVYTGSYQVTSTTTAGMCVDGSVWLRIYAPGSTTASYSGLAQSDCSGSAPSTSTESFGNINGVGVPLAAGSKIRVTADFGGPTSQASGTSDASFSFELKEILPPVSNTSPPALTGSGVVGTAVSTSNGLWQGSPYSFTYQWRSGGANVPGATAPSYTVQPADVGKVIQCYVTASNGSTQSSQFSNGVVAKSPPQLFSNTKKPKLEGQAKVGKKLTAKPGTWTPTPTTTTYQWLRNGEPIDGATKATYKLKAKDEGKKVSVSVTVKRSGYLDATATSKAKKVKPKD